MAWLSQIGQPVDERDISKNPAYIDEIMALGSRSTPTTVIEQDGQRHVVMGFDRPQLMRLLKV